MSQLSITISQTEEIAIALALPLLMMVTQVAHSLYRRLYGYIRARCIVRISRLIMEREEPSDKDILSLRRRFSPDTITDAARFISEHIYGNAHHRLMLITEVCEVELSPLKDSELCDLSTFIEAYPDRAIRYIARLSRPLSWYEVALLTQLLRRTGTSIVYTPLLTSQNRNLQIIGVYLSELFAITDAEPHLQQLSSSPDEEVAYMALLTLCSIRGDISSPQVACALMRLTPYQRTTFIRHAVQACYTPLSCATLLSTEEQRLFIQQLNSYKCQIKCN